jgi:hypothetical protein
MKRIALVAALLAASMFVLAGTAMAGDGYGWQPGFTTATDNTICAGAGAFGAFGTTGDVYHDFGINNDKNATVPSRVPLATWSGSATRLSAATAKAAPIAYAATPV